MVWVIGVFGGNGGLDYEHLFGLLPCPCGQVYVTTTARPCQQLFNYFIALINYFFLPVITSQ
jgi:hypothetical protein